MPVDVLSGDGGLSLLDLFLKADFVVKLVMLVLVLISLWCWAIIFEKFLRLGQKEKLISLKTAFGPAVRLMTSMTGSTIVRQIRCRPFLSLLCGNGVAALLYQTAQKTV